MQSQSFGRFHEKTFNIFVDWPKRNNREFLAQTLRAKTKFNYNILLIRTLHLLHTLQVTPNAHFCCRSLENQSQTHHLCRAQRIEHRPSTRAHSINTQKHVPKSMCDSCPQAVVGRIVLWRQAACVISTGLKFASCQDSATIFMQHTRGRAPNVHTHDRLAVRQPVNQHYYYSIYKIKLSIAHTAHI